MFVDDFSKDTRADYTINGDVTWEPGKLTLAEGAWIEQTIDGGPWAKVELDLEHVPLTTAQPTAELRVWFNLLEATPCYVLLRRQLVDGKPIEQVVREVTVDDLASGTVSVDYHNGLVLVTVKDDQRFASYIENGSATVSAVTLESVSTAVGFRNFSAAAIQANEREFTEAEQEELAKAAAANSNVNSLYREGNYATATEILEPIVDIKKSVLGEQHPDYTNSLNNLAMLYSHMGDYARAEPLFRQALSGDWR